MATKKKAAKKKAAPKKKAAKKKQLRKRNKSKNFLEVNRVPHLAGLFFFTPFPQ